MQVYCLPLSFDFADTVVSLVLLKLLLEIEMLYRMTGMYDNYVVWVLIYECCWVQFKQGVGTLKSN